MLYLIGAFALSYLAAFGATPLTRRVATRLNILDHPHDHPEGYKRHPSAVPYLGGVAIICGLAAGSVMLFGATRAGGPPDWTGQLLAGAAVALGLGAMGLIDDIRPLPRVVRLAIQIGAAVAAWSIGFRVEATASTELNILLTVFWIVGITNAFNLLDNVDGLTAGLAGIGAASFAIMGYLEDLTNLGVVAAGLAGASLGFLAHNRHPARVFMGDSGSLFLGFLLALIGLKIRFDNLQEVTFLVPVVALGLPIFDTTLVVVSRLRHGRSPFKGGHDHVSHRLIRLGFPVKVTVGFLYWTALCLGWLAAVISRSNVEVGWMLLAFVIAMGVFFGTLLRNVPVYEERESPLIEEQPAIDPDELVSAAEEHRHLG